jgi:hypothetical protein
MYQSVPGWPRDGVSFMDTASPRSHIFTTTSPRATLADADEDVPGLDVPVDDTALVDSSWRLSAAAASRAAYPPS